MNQLSDADTRREGVYYALFAYVFWGVVPIYFVWVGFALPIEILAHRILWSIPLLAGLIWLTRSWRELTRLGARELRLLAVCSVLLSLNWLTFIYAISVGRIAETSLGYFINPIVTIVLGRVFLGEPMRPLQWLAAALAACGVVVELAWLGSVPMLALVLAFSFGFYGLVRKHVAVSSPVGLGVETSFVVPFALGYLVWLGVDAQHPTYDLSQYALLGLGGAITVTPLLAFGAAARRLPLTLLGFFQYIAPSLSLVIAVLVFDESVSDARWMNLALIWVALVLFSVESWLHQRRVQAQPVSSS